MALPVLWFIRKEITKQVSYELHALRAIKIFFKDFNWSSVSLVWNSFDSSLLTSIFPGALFQALVIDSKKAGILMAPCHKNPGWLSNDILSKPLYKKHSFSTSLRNQKRVLPNLWLHLAEPSQKIYRRAFASMELQTFTLTSCFFDSSVHVFRILP